MARNGFKVLDADTHVYEPCEQLETYLPSRWKDALASSPLGPDTLMFGTDYPHTECWSPRSVETVLGWKSLSDQTKRKLLWDNGVSLYRRCRTL